MKGDKIPIKFLSILILFSVLSSSFVLASGETAGPGYELKDFMKVIFEQGQDAGLALQNKCLGNDLPDITQSPCHQRYPDSKPGDMVAFNKRSACSDSCGHFLVEAQYESALAYCEYLVMLGKPVPSEAKPDSLESYAPYGDSSKPSAYYPPSGIDYNLMAKYGVIVPESFYLSANIYRHFPTPDFEAESHPTQEYLDRYDKCEKAAWTAPVAASQDQPTTQAPTSEPTAQPTVTTTKTSGNSSSFILGGFVLIGLSAMIIGYYSFKKFKSNKPAQENNQKPASA